MTVRAEGGFLDREGPFEQRPRLGRVAVDEVIEPILQHRPSHRAVVRPEDRLTDREYPLVRLLCLLHLRHGAVHVRLDGKGSRHRQRVAPPGTFENGDRSIGELDRLVVGAALPASAGQVDEHGGEGLIFGADGLLEDHDRSFEQVDRLPVVAGVQAEGAERIEAVGHRPVVRIELLQPQLQRPLQQCLGIVVLTERQVDLAEDRLELGLDQRLALEVAVDPLGSVLEEVVHGRRVGDRRARPHGPEHAPQQAHHLVRGLGLALGPNQADGRANDTANHRQHHGHARSHAQPVPTYELAQPVDRARRARLDRLVAEVPADVRRQLGRRGIATGPVLFERSSW